MGRRRSGGRSYSSTGSSSPRFRSSPSLKKSSPKPAKTKDEKAPPPGGSNSGSFRSTIADGFRWGTGIALGHIFVQAIFGPRTIRQEIVVPDYSETCDISYNAFLDCLKVPGNNLSKCHLFKDSWIRCLTARGIPNSSSS